MFTNHMAAVEHTVGAAALARCLEPLLGVLVVHAQKSVHLEAGVSGLGLGLGLRVRLGLDGLGLGLGLGLRLGLGLGLG